MAAAESGPASEVLALVRDGLPEVVGRQEALAPALALDVTVEESHYPGHKPPFWAVERSARPYKSTVQTGLLWETLRPLKHPGRIRTGVGVDDGVRRGRRRRHVLGPVLGLRAPDSVARVRVVLVDLLGSRSHTRE